MAFLLSLIGWWAALKALYPGGAFDNSVQDGVVGLFIAMCVLAVCFVHSFPLVAISVGGLALEFVYVFCGGDFYLEYSDETKIPVAAWGSIFAALVAILLPSWRRLAVVIHVVAASAALLHWAKFLTHE